MDNLRATPQSGVKTQTTSLSLYLGPQPDNEPVTLFRLIHEGRIVVTALLAARERDTEKLTENRSPKAFANMKAFSIQVYALSTLRNGCLQKIMQYPGCRAPRSYHAAVQPASSHFRLPR